MAEPRLTSRTPTACAGCYGCYPERDHVDFRSAIEGGPIDSTNPRSPRVDWVVLCEKCITGAFSLLPEQRDTKARLEAELAAAVQRATNAESYSVSLESALARRPEIEPTPAHDDVPPAPDAAQVENLEATIAALTERAEAAENLASNLEDALAHRPSVEAPAREPRSPRPRASSQAKRKAAGGQAKPGPQRRNRYARDAA